MCIPNNVDIHFIDDLETLTLRAKESIDGINDIKEKLWWCYNHSVSASYLCVSLKVLSMILYSSCICGEVWMECPKAGILKHGSAWLMQSFGCWHNYPALALHWLMPWKMLPLMSVSPVMLRIVDKYDAIILLLHLFWIIDSMESIASDLHILCIVDTHLIDCLETLKQTQEMNQQN